MNNIPQYQSGVDKLGAIKLSSNENNYPISPIVQNAIVEALSNVNKYPTSSHHELKQALAEQYQIQADNIFLGNGSDEILSIVTQALLSKGDYAISAKETFSIYNIATVIAQANMTQIPLLNGFFDLEAIQKEAQNIMPKIIFICNPNNPTGTYHSSKTLEAFIKKIPEQTYIVLDEAYIDFVTGYTLSSYQEMLSWHPNIIILRTFSKAFAMAGLRLGIGIGNKNNIEMFESRRMPFNINSLAYAASIAALKDFDYYKNIIKTIIQERMRMETHCSTMGYKQFPSQGNFVAINMNKLNNSDLQFNEPIADIAFKYFEQNNIMVRSLTSFSLPNMLRISIGTPEENTKVLNVLNSWGNYYHSLT